MTSRPGGRSGSDIFANLNKNMLVRKTRRFPGAIIVVVKTRTMSEGKIRIGDICLFTKVNLYLQVQYSAVYTSLKNYHKYHLIFFFVQELTG